LFSYEWSKLNTLQCRVSNYLLDNVADSEP